MSDLMAWHGVVEMKEAKWTDQEGSTVTFFLPMHGQQDKRNPFEKFTKRRKGRAGTRFMMACHRITDTRGDYAVREAMYEDEAMLAGWNDSQSTGHTVKFWLCNDGMGHPFEGCSRKRDQFALSLMELDDDQEPVDQKMRQRVEEGKKHPSERLSYVAAMLCKSQRFWEWATEMIQQEGWIMSKVSDESSARQFILDICGIQSRSELDQDGQHVQTFHDEIRKPYLVYFGEA